MADEAKQEPATIEITGTVNCHFVRVDQPEPGFLIQMQGQATSMSAFMTDAAMAGLIKWIGGVLPATDEEKQGALAL
jgi:hypothetical protein